MRKIAVLIGAILFLGVSLCLAEEEITITTYYPSPYGSYNELTTISNTYLATGGGNVGIGTASPMWGVHNSKGHLVFDIATTENTDKVNNADPKNLGIGFKVSTGNVLGALISTSQNSNWGADIHFNVRNGSGGNFPSTPAMTVQAGGNVGIGTASPDEKLHVAGRVKIVDGNQGAGKVLTSDANGVGTWQAGGGNFTTGCHYLCGWFGVPVNCPSGEVVTGMCGSGGNADCACPTGGGCSHWIKCCRP